MLSDTSVAILAGGLGTRLASVVADRPKALAEVLGRPFLSYLLDQLADAGLRRAVLCTGFKAEMVQEAFGDRFGPLALEYSPEAAPLGTGGALRAALPRLDSPTVLVVNADSLCASDLGAFANWHVAQQSTATLLLAQVSDTSRFGRCEVDAQGRITQFHEKGQQAAPGWINAGLYLLGRHIVEQIPPDIAVSLERDVFPALVKHRLLGYQGGNQFLDIGTPESYAAAAEFLSQGWPRSGA